MVRPRMEIDVVETFRAPRTLTLEELCRKIHASRSTVLRRLEEHGYHSSYNQAGKFLTIDEVAQFDARGLWVWKAARFSRHGSLKETVWHFVEDSQQGMTQEELAALLGVRTHNPLLELVQQEWTQRERLGPTFVYLSHKATRRREQVRRRKALLAESMKPRPTPRQIIATLLELIKDPRAERDEIVLRCQRSGVPLSRELVDAVFQSYDLDKKRAL
jgi:transcriptional regulator with XRE-family HTH domain